MQVLIVEDDIRLAQALGRILEENDYQVDIVHDGQAGLDYAVSGIYDVVILDLMLPKMDGYAVVRELRRARIDTPVLMLTARGTIPDKITGLDSGADDYMTKPFSPAEANEEPGRARAHQVQGGGVGAHATNDHANPSTSSVSSTSWMFP